jgi:hypothetical protein
MGVHIEALLWRHLFSTSAHVPEVSEDFTHTECTRRSSLFLQILTVENCYMILHRAHFSVNWFVAV